VTILASFHGETVPHIWYLLRKAPFLCTRSKKVTGLAKVKDSGTARLRPRGVCPSIGFPALLPSGSMTIDGAGAIPRPLCCWLLMGVGAWREAGLGGVGSRSI